MTEEWLAALGDKRAEGASDEALAAASAQLRIDLPADYMAVMRAANGGERGFGESWIVLWKVDDLAERNDDYEVAQFAPGFTYFGSNGGGEAYAWDWRPERRSRYVVVPFIGPRPETAVPCGETFEEFLSVLHAGIPF